MREFKVNEERTGLAWFLRMVSLAAIIAVVVAIGFALHKGNATLAIFLLIATAGLAVFFSWNWTGSLFAPFEWARRYVQGVEGDHRHEWYSFKGQRVRVLLDATGQPWFALNEITHILDLGAEQGMFRHYGPHEYGVPESASEPYLSESGLWRLIKYSAHPDADALGLWLEREVLRVLRRKAEILAADGSKPSG